MHGYLPTITGKFSNVQNFKFCILHCRVELFDGTPEKYFGNKIRSPQLWIFLPEYFVSGLGGHLPYTGFR